VQYAHARIASILKLAEQNHIDFSSGDVSLLTTAPEQALIKKMLLLPEIVETVAQSLSPHHLAYYAQELATEFHSFYKDCRVVDMENRPLTSARLKLVASAKIVLSRTLNLMGVTAPDKM
jgi:arginyl-tRNA synthetase